MNHETMILVLILTQSSRVFAPVTAKLAEGTLKHLNLRLRPLPPLCLTEGPHGANLLLLLLP